MSSGLARQMAAEDSLFRAVVTKTHAADPDSYYEAHRVERTRTAYYGPYTSHSSAASMATRKANERGPRCISAEGHVEAGTVTWEKVAK